MNIKMINLIDMTGFHFLVKFNDLIGNKVLINNHLHRNLQIVDIKMLIIK